MSIEPGDFISVVVEHQITGSSNALMVFSYLVEDGAASDNADIMADWEDWVTNAWHALWDSIAAESATIVKVAVDRVTQGGLVLENIGESGLDLPGAVASTINAAADAAFLYASTSRPKTRGRKFVPGLADAHFAGGYLSGSALAVMAGLLIEYLTGVIGNTTGVRYQPGVRSNPASPGTPSWQPFTGTGVTTDRPGYQRRRAPGVGS